MLLTNLTPCPQLSTMVRFYRIVDFDFQKTPAPAQTVKFYRPRIEHCLQFTPFDPEIVRYGNRRISEPVAIFGQHNCLTSREVGHRFLNFQVVFQPGILPALCRIPAGELTNVYTSADSVIPLAFHTVNEQLAHCRNYAEMTAVVEHFLIEWLRRRHPRQHPAEQVARRMLDAGDVRSIGWYAGQANLSFRQFDRVFDTMTGITPGVFRSLVRLDKAYLLKNRNPGTDWLSIALESGFHDYQHLSRTYRQFTGYSPTAFYQLEKQAPERHFGFFEQ